MTWMLTTVLPRLATHTPTPAEKNPELVTPGVWGFIAIFVVGVAVLLLGFDMVRRIRRVRYRAEIAAKLDAEEAELAASGDAGEAGSAPARGDSRDDSGDAPGRGR